MKYTVVVGSKTFTIEIGADNRILLDGAPHQVDFQTIQGGPLYSLLLDHASWELLAEQNHDEYRISIEGELHLATVMDERMRKIESALGKASAATGDAVIKAPMPGLVHEVLVGVDQPVKASQGVLILEAMKMQNELRAPRDGSVKDVRVKSGDKVEQGQTLIVIK